MTNTATKPTNFKSFSDAVNNRLNEIAKTGKLFTSKFTGQQLWDLYLASFQPGHDPVFRDPASSTHNGNNDKNFIRRYGNIIAVDADFNIITLFDMDLPEDSKYYAPAKALSNALKSAEIEDVFFETFDELNKLPYERCNKNQTSFRLGIEENHKQYTQEEADKFKETKGVVTAGEIRKFNHFYADLPKAFVDTTGTSQASILSKYRDDQKVFERGLREIPLDTYELVRDLIVQGSLLNGDAQLAKVNEFISFKKEYDSIPSNKKDAWCWVKSYKLPIAKFRGELIGTLCVDLAEGKELNEACKTWNIRVDPTNYMKAKAPITKRQIEEAQKFVEENGYTESFNRRLATIADINIDEILHTNADTGQVKTASIFDGVKPAVSTRHKRSQFEGIEEVGIDKFMSDILPNATLIELFLENRMEGNLVNITTASSNDSKPIFKWDNNKSWTFKGGLAGKSQIKESVKERGGKVDGDLRFSIMWADGDGDNSDLDAWAKEPDGTQIGYSTEYRKDRGGERARTMSSGQLDVDITDPSHYGSKNIVENIAWTSKTKMRNGEYTLWVNQFSARSSKGFKAEIEIEGEIYSYEYNQPVTSKANIKVAKVTLKDGVFSIEHLLPETSSSKQLWGLDTNEFQKVSLVCLSPNFWGKNEVGHKHFMFMLDGCACDEPVRGFHNENLNSDLLQHRKVLEVLGSTSNINPVKGQPQLAGVGFNATVRDEIIVKVSGSFKRTLKIKI